MKNSIKIFSVLILLLSISCSGVSRMDDITKNSKPFVIWAHSDIQAKKPEHFTNFATAVNDMAALGHVDIAVTGGDIVEKKNVERFYRSYLENRKKIDTDAWYEIAGNHEWKQIDKYKKFINKNLFYSVRAGNILFLFISNAETVHITYIPPRVVQWWKKKVIENQDKIIVTFTHATLKGSGLIQSKLGIKRLYIKNSEDFEQVLKKYRVDLWISGHSHIPGYLPYTDNRSSYLNDTVFIDTGAIRIDFMTGIESRLLYFYNNTNIVRIKHRDHSKRKFIKSRERVYRLSKKFSIKNGSRIKIDEILRTD